jgi:hypothetical protein
MYKIGYELLEKLPADDYRLNGHKISKESVQNRKKPSS